MRLRSRKDYKPKKDWIPVADFEVEGNGLGTKECWGHYDVENRRRPSIIGRDVTAETGLGGIWKTLSQALQLKLEAEKDKKNDSP